MSTPAAEGGGLFGRIADRLAEQGDDGQPAFVMADLLELPAGERTVLRHMMRRGDASSRSMLAEELPLSPEVIDASVDALVGRKALVEVDGVITVAQIAATRRITPGGLWDRLSGL